MYYIYKKYGAKKIEKELVKRKKNDIIMIKHFG